MKEIAERTRVSRAELFVTEALFDAVSDVSDDAYYGDRQVEGLLLGYMYHDIRGIYGISDAVAVGTDALEHAVGWFRTSADGVNMSQRDVDRHRSLFGRDKAFAIMVDNVASSFAVYTVEDGVPRKVQVAFLEG